jgi:hypothetical protein
MATAELQYDVNNLYGMEANSAVHTTLDGTNVDTPVLAFDDTTEEYVNGKLKVPADIDTSGTVTFRTFTVAETAAALNVAHTFGHAARDHDEDYDGAYTDEDSGDKAMNATQDDLIEHTWTETVANLGWTAHDLVFFRYSRPQASANNLTDDMYLAMLIIEIPLV